MATISKRWRIHGAIAAILAVGTLLLYFNTLDYAFVFDDISSITENEAVRITSLSLNAITDAAAGGFLKRRVVPNLSFAINYYFAGYDAKWYRLTNVVIHIANGILVYCLALMHLQILRRCTRNAGGTVATIPRKKPTRPEEKAAIVVAAIVAALWLAHPLQTNSTIYIVQRMTSLAVFFYLAALCLYLAGRLHAARQTHRWSLFSAAVIAWGIAMVCKEISLTLPLAVLTYEIFFFQSLSREWFARNLKYIVILLVVLAVVALTILGTDPLQSIREGYARRDFTMGQRVLTQFRVIVLYVSLLLLPLPSRLNLDHHVIPSVSLIEPMTTLLSLIALILLAGAAVLLFRRHRMLAFCIIWFFLHLAIESSIIGLEMAFEHRLYLPSVGFIFAVVYLVHRYFRFDARLKCASAAVIGLLLCVSTIARSTVWKNSITLWTDCVGKSPGKARPYNNLGQYLAEQKDLTTAEKLLRKAVKLKPDFADAHNNLAAVLRQQNNLDEAIKHYREAIRIQPAFPEAHYNLGIALRKNNQIDAAICHYRESLRYDSRSASTYHNLGVAYAKKQDYDQAISYFKEALRIRPDFAKAQASLEAMMRRKADTP